MATTQQMQDIQKKFEGLSHSQATARIAVLPAQVVYESRFALQEVRESELSEEDKATIIEPLARAIGWVEALSYVFDTQREMLVAPTETKKTA